MSLHIEIPLDRMDEDGIFDCAFRDDDLFPESDFFDPFGELVDENRQLRSTIKSMTERMNRLVKIMDDLSTLLTDSETKYRDAKIFMEELKLQQIVLSQFLK